MSLSTTPDSTDPILSRLESYSKFKQRSHDTHHNAHLSELSFRLGLDRPNPSTETSIDTNADPLAPTPNFSNKKPINVVYLGNSMLERLKTTGQDTKLRKLDVSWNAGCGGDKNENVVYRLLQGLHRILKDAQETDGNKCDVKVWILASETNNLHPKHGLRESDVESWRVLVEACSDIAPESVVLACDVFYRKDVRDDLVDEGNEMLRKVAGEMGERLKWVEARHLLSKDMLEDHVHLNEEGYAVWDGVLWPYVAEALAVETE